MKCALSVYTEVDICHYLFNMYYWFTGTDDVQLEQVLSNCIRQRDELLEIKQLSECQSVMLRRLRETVTAGEFIF